MKKIDRWIIKVAILTIIAFCFRIHYWLTDNDFSGLIVSILRILDISGEGFWIEVLGISGAVSILSVVYLFGRITIYFIYIRKCYM